MLMSPRSEGILYSRKSTRFREYRYSRILALLTAPQDPHLQPPLRRIPRDARPFKSRRPGFPIRHTRLHHRTWHQDLFGLHLRIQRPLSRHRCSLPAFDVRLTN